MNLTSLSKGQEKAGNFSTLTKVIYSNCTQTASLSDGPSPSVLLVGAGQIDDFHRPGVGHIQQYSASGSARKQDLRQVVWFCHLLHGKIVPHVMRKWKWESLETF